MAQKQVTDIHPIISKALFYHIGRKVKEARGGRGFFRLDGFDSETYKNLAHLVEKNGDQIEGRQVWLRSVEPIDGNEDYALEETKSATWYRNHLPDEHTLVLIFNGRTSDDQSLDDIYPITESVLTDDGIDELLRAAFTDYDLNPGEAKLLKNQFLSCFRKHLYQPQLRDLAFFLRDIDKYLSRNPEKMERAIAESLPQLNLFRCRQLADVIDSTTKLRRLLNANLKGSRRGREQLDHKERQKYLDNLEKAEFDDTPGGLSAEEKEERLRDFLLKINTDRESLLRIYKIDWSEVDSLLYHSKRKTKKERLREIGQELKEAFDDQGIEEENLPESIKETVDELTRGSQPDDASLDELIMGYGESVPGKLRGRVKRLRRPPKINTENFAEGIVQALTEIVVPLQEETGEGVEVKLRPESLDDLREGDLDGGQKEALLAFQLFYGGIEKELSNIDWRLDELWTLTEGIDFGLDEDSKSVLTEETVSEEIDFRVEAYDTGSEKQHPDEYCKLTWAYNSEETSGATLANILHEHRIAHSLRQEDEDAAVGVPVYDTAEKHGTVDLSQPIDSLGTWYRNRESDEDLRQRLERRLRSRARPEVLEKVEASLEDLEGAWTDFVLEAPREGIPGAKVETLLDAYENHLSTVVEHLQEGQEVKYGYGLVNTAWMIGPKDSYDEWAVMPPIHPLKLIWTKERLRAFNKIIGRLTAEDGAGQIVDEARLKKEIPTAYSSSTFPSVIALPNRNQRSEYLVPVSERKGYELFRRLNLAGISHGLDTELSTEEDSQQAAEVVADELSRVIDDYRETYPFVEDGLEVFLVECRNEALPGRLAEAIGKKIDAEEQGRCRIIVHTTDRGVSLYDSISEWIETDEKYTERSGNSYFPNISIKVRECSYEKLFRQVEDRDLVILPDVLASRGQQIDSETEANEEDRNRDGYLPLYRLAREPFDEYGNRRDVSLTPEKAPRLMRLFYNCQGAAKEESPAEKDARSIFKRKISLSDWSEELSHFHEAFNWVVCYDTSVDRHLLQATFPDEVQVIRHSTGLGKQRQHNLTVSSSHRVEQIVKRRLASNLKRMFRLADDDFRLQLAGQFIDESKEISGDIILRATGPGTYLNEIIGLIATKYVVETRFDQEHSDYAFTWLYLDDYSHWFDGKLPDLLFAAISASEEGIPLRCQVIESKCVAEGSFLDESKDAQRQVANGVNRLAQAWHPGRSHIDAPYWYHQLYQALAGNIKLGPQQESIWRLFRQALRSGEFRLDMSGHSWVFCHNGSSGISGSVEEHTATTTAPDVNLTHKAHLHSEQGLRGVMRDLADRWEMDDSLSVWQDGATDSGDALPSESESTHNEAPAGAQDREASRAEVEQREKTQDTKSKDGRESPSEEAEIAPRREDSADGSREKDGEPSADNGNPGDVELDAIRGWIEEKSDKLQTTLGNYGVNVYPVNPQKADVGPSIVRFKVRMKPGERLNKIQNIAEDLQRELATDTVPLVDNVSGESFVGIDLPRPEAAIAQLDEELHRIDEHGGELPFLLGVSPAGRTKMADLASLPHLLVAGSTGSGKTIFLYSVILSLIKSHTPETLKTILVDPKQTDFIYFDDLPHLLSDNVIIEPTEAIDWLRRLMDDELQRRTKLLREARARNITDYNRDKADSEALPYIVVVIDEYADLVHALSGSDRDEFERQLVRLAQRARNVGIHLVIATQRPSADIVTTRLKTNLPARVAFRLPSHHDSSTILDRSGAEKLIGKGDMLALMEGDMQRLQGFYVSPERLEEMVRQVGVR
jgi:hypothetical protein